ncbi:PRKCA-binding protein isoform X1 [Anopheles gambiae]|uniref:PRKCA-binding protein isoform X1 n=1 Tax=Anopheles gambiae TaxID=7165 RepID=UPI002AC93FA1|nr:PRKCA-binding protein isoform X1 [Anopheles gambiae]XP_061518154.1 PRKCA-binding protein isoform X1 [Anopheles gambiae]
MDTSKDSELWCEETTSLLQFDHAEDNTFDSNPIRPTKAVVVDEEKANGDDQDTALIVIGSPGNGPRPFQTERRMESKKLASEQDDAKPEKESTASKRMDDIAFVSNDDLPDPVLYADGCVDDNKIIMLCQRQEMERLGMTVSSGTVVIKKDTSNLIGISIGGGAPLCPCLYIVQVFDGTPAAREGTLQSGDELLGVNGVSVKGKTKVEVAKMIQSATEEVMIHYNKLHADPTQGETLDIVLKKMKHRLVERMSSSTADTLGLSRAILCNDSLVKRLQELERTETMYKGLVDHARRMLKAHFDVLQTYQAFGNIFASISVREPQPRASEAFRIFGELHRNMEKDGIKMIKTLKPILADMGTYLHKAIPDTKLTVKRYADAKFSYLSYCLKIKEMDDEEHGYAAIQEPLYRVETGNYEYRLILRCRQEARLKFAKLRSDVLEKIELLECKHARDLASQLRKFIEGLATLASETVERLESIPNLFPIEVDLKASAFQYKSAIKFQAEEYTDEEIPQAEEAIEQVETAKSAQAKTTGDLEQSNGTDVSGQLLGGFEEIDLNKGTSAGPSEHDLLNELGLAGIDLSVSSKPISHNLMDDLLVPELFK